MSVNRLYLNQGGIERLTSSLIPKCDGQVHIFLTGNKLVEVPPNIFDSNVYELHLNHNHISRTFANSFSIQHLQLLNLTGNLLTSLPIPGLPESLEILHLSDNRFTKIPANAFTSNNLTHLYLSDCQIETIDDAAFVNLTKLQRLHLDNNKLKTMPRIPDSLQDLYIKHNQISSVSITSTSLDILILDSNPINKVEFTTTGIFKPENTGIFKTENTGIFKLKQLHINNTHITEFPSFANLHQLDSLYMCMNKQLTTIPANTFVGCALTELMLGNNNISIIEPGAFNTLDKLETLDISNNNIANLKSDMFMGLPKLISLRANRMRLPIMQSVVNICVDQISNRISPGASEWISPGAFKNLPMLTKLYISGLEIKTLNEGIFSDLTSLQELYLTDNKFTEISPNTFARSYQLRTIRLCREPTKFDNIIRGTLQYAEKQRIWQRKRNILTELAIGLRYMDFPVLVILEILSHMSSEEQHATFYANNFLKINLVLLWDIAKLIKHT